MNKITYDTPEGLEFICFDHDYYGNTQSWFFDEKEKRFVRFNKQKVFEKSLGINFLSNPMDLWKMRCDDKGLDIDSKEALALKPTKATFALYDVKLRYGGA